MTGRKIWKRRKGTYGANYEIPFCRRLAFGFGPRLRGLSAAFFLYSASRFSITVRGTDNTEPTSLSNRVNASGPSIISA